MIETSARLLRLLSLLNSRRFWTGPELAAALGTTVRTVRRDIERLREMDYPVEASPGVGGGYQLGRSGSLPPLLLNDDEAVAVAVGLRAGVNGSITGLEESAMRALATLEQSLPARLRRRVTAVQRGTVSVPFGGPMVNAADLQVVAAACRDLELLRFSYQSGAGEVTSRHVEPHRLVNTGRRWYLMAWDVDRADWRSFRADRLSRPQATARRFTPRAEAPDPVEFISQSISTAPYRHQACVLVHAPASTVRTRVPATVGTIEEIDQQHCRLRTGSDSLTGLAVELLALDREFHVEEPDELREHVVVLAERMRRAAQPGSSPSATS